MRRILIGFCLGTGVLGLLASTLSLDGDPVAFVILFPISMLALSIFFMPAAFVLGMIALMSSFLFGSLGRIARRTATVLVLTVPLLLACLASAHVNRPLNRQWQALSERDHPWSGSAAGTCPLAILEDWRTATILPSRVG
jgi:hypothetical protein